MNQHDEVINDAIQQMANTADSPPELDMPLWNDAAAPSKSPASCCSCPRRCQAWPLPGSLSRMLASSACAACGYSAKCQHEGLGINPSAVAACRGLKTVKQ